MTIDEIAWPSLDEPYATALSDAVGWILDQVQPLGIIACGSIIRGNPGPTSDLDVVVVNGEPLRQRVQRRFNGIPTEFFVNPPAAIRHYFVTENRTARPSTAHMIAHGFVMLAQDPVVATLVSEAQTWWETPPSISPFQRAMTRYSAVDLLDNAADLLAGAMPDPANAQLLLQRAMHEMVCYFFYSRTQNVPRDKELFQAVARIDPDAGRLIRAVYLAETDAERLARARTLADHVLGTHEFYPWETEPERFPPEQT